MTLKTHSEMAPPCVAEQGFDDQSKLQARERAPAGQLARPKRVSTSILEFELEKNSASHEGRWRLCKYRKCKRRRTCTGGPRGTFRKTGGVPLCKRPLDPFREIEEIMRPYRQILEREMGGPIIQNGRRIG